MTTPADYLRDHRFKALFTDHLGWEHAAANLTVSVDERDFTFVSVAHKRGLQVLCGSADRAVLVNRTLVRKVQRLVARSIHEHILIFTCEEPRKQVWLWAIRLPDGRKVRHREHPFFSDTPPSRFLSRISGLRFTLEEEQGVTLVDALDRVRRVLDTAPDLNLFVRRPWYAERSDQLVRAIQNGDAEAFHRFLVLHLPLARQFSKRLCGWFDMLPEDAEQIAFLGLLRAAQKYRPELGNQFSTYAIYWLKHACQRQGPDFALMIRLPAHVFWPCFRMRLALEDRMSAVGAAGVRAFLTELDLRDPRLGKQFRDFERATAIQSLSEREHYRAACRIAEPWTDPLDALKKAELAERVQKAVGQLHTRLARIIRLRYGFNGCPAQSLQEISELFGVSRERIRQLQRKAEARLRHLLREDKQQRGHADLEVEDVPAAAKAPKAKRPSFQSVTS